MKKVIALSVCVALAACTVDKSDKLIQLDANLPVAETVNGTPVPQALLESLAHARNIDLGKPEQRAKALTVLADFVLLAEQARRDQLISKPAAAADVEYARLSALSSAAMEALQAQTPLSDEQVKAEYDTYVAKAGKFDCDFSGLLFDNEASALAATGELHGKTFAQVYDAWKDKAKQAKIFTKVHVDQLPEELGKALAAMKPGDTTPAPVKTQFGWHLLSLTAVNPLTPPPFDQVKEGIRRSMAAKVARQRLEKLREQAKIEYPPGTAPVAKPAPEPEAKPAAPTATQSQKG